MNVWPATLQDKLNVGGFTYEFGETTVESTMDTGPKKKRRRFTHGIDTVAASIDLDFDDYTTFETFYKTTLNGGVNTFYYDHPLTQVQETWRMGGVKITPIGGRRFNVSMVWELMS